jgi:hypothetical protein
MTMENEKSFSNGHDKEIEPDLISEEVKQPTLGYTLDDLATEDDDIEILGDNVLNHIEVRRPHAQEWFRSHPTWKISTRAVIDKRGTKETVYLVHKCLMPYSESLKQDSYPVLVQACTNTKGKIFLWVCRKLKDDGDPSTIYKTALEHIDAARTNWIRRFWIDSEKKHVKRTAQLRTEPVWPDVAFKEIILAGFGSRVISDENAPILRELRGEDSNA